MSAQTNYSYHTPIGVAGGLYDLSPYSIDSRINGEADPGVMKFGMGVVQGVNPGVEVLVPTDASVGSQFEGLLLTGHIQMQNMKGELKLQPQQIVGVLRWGKAWARVENGITPAYGESLYLIIDGDDAGLFTNDDAKGDNLEINGRFIGGLGTGDIAPVEIYNQKP